MCLNLSRRFSQKLMNRETWNVNYTFWRLRSHAYFPESSRCMECKNTFFLHTNFKNEQSYKLWWWSSEDVRMINNIGFIKVDWNYRSSWALLLFAPRVIYVFFPFHWQHETTPRIPICMFDPWIIRVFPFFQTSTTMETNSAVVTSYEYQI